MGGWMGEWVEGWMDRWMNGRKEGMEGGGGWVYESVDGLMGGGWMDGYML